MLHLRSTANSRGLLIMECVPGDIVWSDFPQTDGEKFQDRPTLVVAKVFGDDVIVCMVTNTKSRFDACIELTNGDMAEGRLDSNPCYIRPVRLFTASPKIFRRKAGRVNDKILQSVLGMLSLKFKPAE